VRGIAATSKLGQLQPFRADAVGVDRFALLGQSQGCAIYAVRHPERVTKLVLIGGFALSQASY
jgi:pimeloyl-ACP methyl ester carboxylesterase